MGRERESSLGEERARDLRKRKAVQREEMLQWEGDERQAETHRDRGRGGT